MSPGGTAEGLDQVSFTWTLSRPSGTLGMMQAWIPRSEFLGYSRATYGTGDALSLGSRKSERAGFEPAIQVQTRITV